MAWHDEEVAPDGIHQVDFVGSTDPSLDSDNRVTAYKRWVDTTGGTGNWVSKIRNAANGAWETIGGAASVAWSSITGKPTTLSGYGITDAASSTHTHAASAITSGTIAPARIASGTATDGHVVTAQSDGTLAFEAPSGGGATTLNDLTDVNTAGLTDGDLLVYDSGTGVWGPAAPSAVALPDDVLREGYNNTFVFPGTTRPATVLDGMGVTGPYTVNEASPVSQNYGAPYNSLYFAINCTAGGSITITLAVTSGNLTARVYNSSGTGLATAASPFTTTIPSAGTYYVELVNVDPHTPSTTTTITLSGTAVLEPFDAAAPVLEPLSPPPFSLTDGATTTLTATGQRVTNATWTIAGNRTLAFVGVEPGFKGTIFVTQDGTGSRTITYPSGSVVLGAISSTAGSRSKIEWKHDGTRFWFEITGPYV